MSAKFVYEDRIWLNSHANLSSSTVMLIIFIFAIVLDQSGVGFVDSLETKKKKKTLGNWKLL